MRLARARRGMVTVEAMVGFVLVGVAIAGISSFMLLSGRAQLGTEQSSQNFRLINDARTILASAQQCTNNFKTSPIPSSVTYAPMPPAGSISPAATDALLRRFDSTGTPTSDPPVVQNGMTFQDIRITSAGVRFRTQIAKDLYLMVYEIVSDRSPRNGMGAKTLVTQIPFAMQFGVDPALPTFGKLVSCFMDPFSQANAAVSEFYCQNQSQFPLQPPLMFDPSTQQCVANWTEVLVNGDAYSASCDGLSQPGQKSKLLECLAASDGSGGSQPPITADMDGGPSFPISAPGSFAEPNGNSCVCDYSDTYSPSGPKQCTARCAVLKTSLVNLWQQPAIQ